MTLSLTCPRCDARVTADDEDELVAKVQSHVRDDHSATHLLSREHILARLHRQDPEKD
jgi:predicted small metal-binding protein